jgi:hypothetical protein
LGAAQSVNQKAAIYSDFPKVELAGLEPATSWVRSSGGGSPRAAMGDDQ